MNPAIDKIKKLLRLSKNGAASAGEAATALAKALQLAAAHGVKIDDIALDDNESALSHETIPSQAGPAHRLASGIVKRHFGVGTLFDSRGGKPMIHFIGFPEQIQLASYCYTYLVRTMRAAWRNRANRRLRDRDAFLRGFAEAIHSLMPAAFHRPGLILRTDSYIKDIIVGNDPHARMEQLKGPKANSSKAWMNGHWAGSKAGIRNAIRGTDKLSIENKP